MTYSLRIAVGKSTPVINRRSATDPRAGRIDRGLNPFRGLKPTDSRPQTVIVAERHLIAGHPESNAVFVWWHSINPQESDAPHTAIGRTRSVVSSAPSGS